MASIIFDLDGTLADTGGDLVAAGNACFKSIGAGDVLDAQQDGATAMLYGAKAMMRLGFERLGHTNYEAEVECLFPLFLASYHENINVYTKLYEGVPKALNQLAFEGHRLGICTNKPFYLADMLLHVLGIRSAFSILIGAGSLPVNKPDPAPLLAAIAGMGGAPGQSLLVGDSPTDRHTSQAAGVKSVLVTFGPTGRDVENLAPHGLLDRYEDLPAVVAQLLG